MPTPERRAKIEEYVASNKSAVKYPDTWTKVAKELLDEIDRLETLLADARADTARVEKLRVEREDLINKAVSRAINDDFLKKLFDPKSLIDLPTGWAEC